MKKLAIAKKLFSIAKKALPKIRCRISAKGFLCHDRLIFGAAMRSNTISLAMINPTADGTNGSDAGGVLRVSGSGTTTGASIGRVAVGSSENTTLRCRMPRAFSSLLITLANGQPLVEKRSVT